MSFIKTVVNTTKDSFTDPFNYKKQLGDSLIGGMLNKNPKAAVLTQQQQDASATAKAQTDAAVEANQMRAAQKRAYQANALALGGFADDSLGQPGGGAAAGAGSTLAQGASAATRAAAASTTSGYTGGTALGGGAGSSGGGGGGRSPSKAMER